MSLQSGRTSWPSPYLLYFSLRPYSSTMSTERPHATSKDPKSVSMSESHRTFDPKHPASNHRIYPPKISPARQTDLVTRVNDWAMAHGLVVRSQPPSTETKENVPPSCKPAAVTLFPSLMPKPLFEQAKDAQKAYNLLYSRIAADEEWLGEVIRE